MSPKCTCSSGGGGKLAAVVVAGLVIASGAHAAGGHKPAAAAVVADAVGHPAAGARGLAAVAYARAQLGHPYVWGGTGPGGFDCSGLTRAAWAAAHVAIPRTSEEQWAHGRRVTHLVPGDLVYSYWAVDDQASPNHVQIYIGHGDVIGADTTDVERTPLSADAGHIVGFTDPAAGGQ